MGWIIRLKKKQLVGGTGEDDVYPITSTGAVYNEGGKDLDTILRELQEAQYAKVLQEVAKNGNTLHFSYTDETTKDIQLPNAFTDVDLTKNGDDNTITFTFADGTNKSITITAPEQKQADWNETNQDDPAYIKNKPNIEGRVQSDWNQLDTNAADYIKNKPAIPVIDAVDIDVTSWGSTNDYKFWTQGLNNYTPNKKSLLYAVGLSLRYQGTGVYTRIHIKQDFEITNETAIDTSNCEIIGHSRTIQMNNQSIYLTGRYFKASDLRLSRISDGSSGDSSAMNTACIRQSMQFVSYIVFDSVTFFNWARAATSDIQSGVLYPRSFDWINVTNAGTSKSLHITCRDCQFPVRPTRLGDNYKSAVLAADYSNCLIRVDVPNERIGAFSIEMTGTVGGIDGTTKSIIGPQKVLAHLSESVQEDMFLYSDGSVDYRYTLGNAADTITPKANGYYSEHKCRIWWGMNNQQIANGGNGGSSTPTPTPSNAVTDVLVNGTSVVSNNIANITIPESGGGSSQQPSFTMPKGCILAWYGSIESIPSGWALCDGRTVNGLKTPNLQDKFILGGGVVGSGDHFGNVKDTGGYHLSQAKTTIYAKDIPVHRHVFTDDTHADNAISYGQIKHTGDSTLDGVHTFSADNSGNGRHYLTGDDIYDYNAAKVNTATSKTITSNDFSIMPPYMILAYIMYVG